VPYTKKITSPRRLKSPIEVSYPPFKGVDDFVVKDAEAHEIRGYESW